MKRLTILALFDKDGIFDEYVFYLINDLRTVSQKIIVVINGSVQDQYFEKLKNVCEDVVVRENTGFDAGAYRHVLLNCLKNDELLEYDQIILCNDTFYGFLQPLSEIFKQIAPTDFWGISIIDEWIEKFIHSYFLVFNKTIINSNELILFFNKESSFDNYADVGYYFERKIFDYLTQKGYSYSTFKGIQEYSIFRESDKNIELGYPILKKKAFIKRNYNHKVIMNSLKQIVDNSSYDINLILSSIKRQFEITITEQDIKAFELDLSQTTSKERMITAQKTQEFIANTPNLYIYGVDGCLTKIMLEKFSLNNLKGFVVSTGHKKNDIYENHPVYEIQQLTDNEDMGIIVALYFANSIKVSSFLNRFSNVKYIWEVLNQ